jgi:hypothetical protein
MGRNGTSDAQNVEFVRQVCSRATAAGVNWGVRRMPTSAARPLTDCEAVQSQIHKIDFGIQQEAGKPASFGCPVRVLLELVLAAYYDQADASAGQQIDRPRLDGSGID